MQAIEFYGTVRDGVIEVPPEYQGQIAGRVRVILLLEPPDEPEMDLVQHLLDHPIVVKGFTPLSREEIYAR